MNRRTFLKTAAVGGVAAAVLPHLQGADAAGTQETKLPGLVAVKGGNPSAMLDAALAAFGGLERFVKPGQTVLIKPNIGWNCTPEQAACTNPELVGHLVELCLKAGAETVQVFDHTCDRDWQACYTRSGIASAVEKAGGVMLCGNVASAYIPVDVKQGKVLHRAELFQAVQSCDVFINVPILKNHGGAKLTCCLKNLMGTIWDRPAMHRAGLQQAIADWASVRKPDLNIVDAFRAMQTGGPRYNPSCKILLPKSLLLSCDMVAADVAAAKSLGVNIDAAAHIGCAEKLGLGTADLSKLVIKKIVMEA